jgi:hypothetical protein
MEYISPIVRPETTTIPLSNGDTITIKTKLNTGEQRRARARYYAKDDDGERQFKAELVDRAIVGGYLVNWTVRDPDQHLVPIVAQPIAAVEAALDALDPAVFSEIRDAIAAHIDAQDAARKNIRDGETRSSATSPSVPAMAGATSG